MEPYPVFKNLDEAFIKLYKSNSSMRRMVIPSDLSMTNLLAWSYNNSIEYAEWFGNLVLRFNNYTDNESFMSFIGTKQCDKFFSSLTKYSQITLNKIDFRFLSKTDLETVENRFIVDHEFTNDDSDYILSTSDLMQMKGGSFSNPRGLVNKFLTLTNSMEIDISYSPLTKNVLSELITVYECREKHKVGGFHNEKNAFIHLFKNIHIIENVHILTIKINKKVEAYVIYDTYSSNATAHFWKANTQQFPGLYQFMLKELCNTLNGLGIATLNFEQDLGISSLRFAKQQLRPLFFVNKFRISKVIGLRQERIHAEAAVSGNLRTSLHDSKITETASAHLDY